LEPSSSRRLRVAAVVAFFALGYAAVLHKFGVQGYLHFTASSSQPGPADVAIKQTFLADGPSDNARYEALFKYFLSGQLAVTDPAGSRAHFKGEPNLVGFKINGMEAFVRGGALLAAWINSGRDPAVADDATGQRADLVAYLKRGLLAGTDPSTHAYWGRFRTADQRIVDAADIARILWMTRSQIWQQLSTAQQAQITAWLQQLNGLDTPANVWLLFPVTVDAVLRSLGQPGFPAYAQSNYAKFKLNYLSNGWFNDPPEGVDFYGAWGVNYELFWIDHIDPQIDHDYIHSILRDAADVDAHLISLAGIPIMGRSICYRTAVSVPLLTANLAGESSVSAGLARHGLDVNWRYFVAHGALQDGTLTQGYFGADPRFLDLYSGPGSCGGWGNRSLLLALLNTPGAEFWRAPPEPLPVERADFQMDYDRLGWKVTGTQANGDIVIEVQGNRGKPDTAPVPYSAWRHLLEPLLCRPFRPPNEAVGYGRQRYSALRPYVLEGDGR
jgi:hypothetical protein